jgi:hypothetical protein
MPNSLTASERSHGVDDAEGEALGTGDEPPA